MLPLQRIKLYHIMKYEFNKRYFSQLCEDRKLTNVALQNALNMTNTTPMNRWRAGKDIRSDHIVRICNAFNVNPAEFFLCDGQPIVLPENVEQTSCVSKKEASNMNQDAISDVSQAKIIAFLHERLEFEKERFMFHKEKDEYERKQMQRELDEIRNELKQEYGSEVTQSHNQQIITASEESDK